MSQGGGNKSDKNSGIKIRHPWFERYDGVEKYEIHPTETNEGRLQFNENLWGPSPKTLEVLKDVTLDDFAYYDLKEKDFLIECISNRIGVPYENILLNAGSSEVLRSIFSVCLQPGDDVLVPSPGWGSYKGMIEALHCNKVDYRVAPGDEEYFHDVEDIISKSCASKPRIIIITSPQMPTGNIISQADLERICESSPDSVVLVDECYYGCAEDKLDVGGLINRYDNIVFVRTLSKIYGLANLRVGYCITNIDFIELIGYMQPLHKLPSVVRKIARAAIEDDEYRALNRQRIVEAREYLYEELNKRNGVKAYRSYSNFVYVKLTGVDAEELHDYMVSNGISTRLFVEDGEAHMRITVGPKEVIDKAMKLLDEGCRLQRER